MGQEPTIKLILDEPVQDGGHDVLGFEAYATTLSHMLTNDKPPYNVALYGDWGSGKSSLARLVEKQLEEHKVPVVNINAWKYSSQTFPRAFLRAILREVDGEDLLDKIETEQSTKMKPVLDLLNEQISWRNPLLVGLVAAVVVGSVAASLGFGFRIPVVEILLAVIIGVYIKELFAFTTTTHTYQRLPHEWLDQFDKEFDRATQKLLDKHQKWFKRQKWTPRIVFFIDDLDRLPPPDAKAALEAIKTYSQGKPTVFLVACDESKIRKALEKDLKENDPRLTPTNFLDKLFQFSFRLPPYPGRNLRAYADSLLSIYHQYPLNVADVLRTERAKILDFLIHPGVTNPRQVKALLNEFAVMHYVVSQKVERNPDTDLQKLLSQPLLLAKLAVIRTDFWELYRDLFLYPDLDGRIVEYSKTVPFSRIDEATAEMFKEQIKETPNDADRRALYYLSGFRTPEQRQKLVNFLIRTRGESTENISLALFMDDDPALKLLGVQIFNELDQAARSGNEMLVRELLERASETERREMVQIIRDRLDSVVGLDGLKMMDVLVSSHGMFTREEKALLADGLSARLIHLSVEQLLDHEPAGLLDFMDFVSNSDERDSVIRGLIKGLHAGNRSIQKAGNPKSIMTALCQNVSLLDKQHVQQLGALLFPEWLTDGSVNREKMLFRVENLADFHQQFLDDELIQTAFFREPFFHILVDELAENGADSPESLILVTSLRNVSPSVEPDIFFRFSVKLLGVHPANHRLALELLEQRLDNLDDRWAGFVQSELVSSLKVPDGELIPRTLELITQTGELLQEEAVRELEDYVEQHKENPDTLELVIKALFPLLPTATFNRFVDSVLWPLVWADKLKDVNKALHSLAGLIFDNSEKLDETIKKKLATELIKGISGPNHQRTNELLDLFPTAYKSETFRQHLEPARLELMKRFGNLEESATTLLSRIAPYFDVEQGQEFISKAESLLQRQQMVGSLLESTLGAIATLAKLGQNIPDACLQRILSKLSQATERTTQVVLEVLLSSWEERTEDLQTSIKDAVIRLMPTEHLASPLTQLVAHLNSNDWINLVKRWGSNLLGEEHNSQIIERWLKHQYEVSTLLMASDVPIDVKEFVRSHLSAEQANATVAVWARQIRERENTPDLDIDAMFNQIVHLSEKLSDLSEVDKMVLGYLVGSHTTLASVLPLIEQIYRTHSPPDKHSEEWINVLPELLEAIQNADQRKHAARITARLGIKSGKAFKLWENEFGRLSSSPDPSDREQVATLKNILSNQTDSEFEVAAGEADGA